MTKYPGYLSLPCSSSPPSRLCPSLFCGPIRNSVFKRKLSRRLHISQWRWWKRGEFDYSALNRSILTYNVDAQTPKRRKENICLRKVIYTSHQWAWCGHMLHPAKTWPPKIKNPESSALTLGPAEGVRVRVHEGSSLSFFFCLSTQENFNLPVDPGDASSTVWSHTAPPAGELSSHIKMYISNMLHQCL